MAESAEYLIVQYLRDPMRKEPRNIGVVVSLGNRRAAKFAGEINSTSEVDGRSTRWAAYPSVYRKWVKYWREQLEKAGNDLFERMTKTNGDNYDVIRGGYVTDYGQDSPETICDNLFSFLVSSEVTSPPASSVEESEWEISSRELEGRVLGEFRNRGIMSGSYQSPSVRHPIFRKMHVSGKRISHVPEFYQHNGRPYVMETINFSTPRKGPAKYHAGYVAKMFDDIRAYNDHTQGIALVHASPRELQDEIVNNSVLLLSDSGSVVNWTIPEERQEFLEERKRLAEMD